MSLEAAKKMSPAEMQRMSDEYWAKHKEVGVYSWSRSPSALSTTVVSAGNFFFNPNPITINQGDSVTWVWSEGVHTTTNGVDENDPNAASMWSASLTSGAPTFTYKFTTAGEFPYFCALHSGFMRGTVTVNATTDVQPIEGTVSKIGFASALTPNPTKAGFSFRFALRQSGHVQADLFDAAGRKVVNLVDKDLGAGTFSASYNGHGAKPGVYWVKLLVPGAQQSRKIVIQQ
jgi:plastocyanin